MRPTRPRPGGIYGGLAKWLRRKSSSRRRTRTSTSSSVSSTPTSTVRRGPSSDSRASSDEKVKEIEALVKSYVEYAPSWAINRQMDYETGADMHLFGNDLDIIQKDDINRMKMIRCYRGIRHEGRHKVRGQRTRSNGRHGLTMGVQRKS